MIAANVRDWVQKIVDLNQTIIWIVFIRFLEVVSMKLIDENQNRGMTISVCIKDIEQFKLFIDMIKDMLTDERIDKEVREEYYHRYLKEVEGNNKKC